MDRTWCRIGAIGAAFAVGAGLWAIAPALVIAAVAVHVGVRRHRAVPVQVSRHDRIERPRRAGRCAGVHPQQA
jgi:hypothetical protein